MVGGYLIFLSTTLAVITLGSNSDYPGLGVGGAFLVASVIYQVALCAKPEFFGEFKDKFNKKRPNFHFYNFMIIERILVGVTFAVITWLSFQCFVVATFYGVELVYIMVKRPYKERNWRPILNMMITIAILAIYYLMNTMKGAVQEYAPLGVLVLLAICFVYSLIILIIELKETFTSLCSKTEEGS